jgi:hypothetical protein
MGKVQGEVFSIEYQVGEDCFNSSQRGTFKRLIRFETPSLPVGGLVMSMW